MRKNVLQTKRSISIHALREEGDESAKIYDNTFDISIHALREEGDLKSDDQMIVRPDFYPRPP